MSLAERNIRQMQLMVDAAKRLITTKGSTFTTQELVAEAGVAIQTFYRHFGGKDQLLLAAIEDMHAAEAVRSAEAARKLPDPVARLRFFIKSAVTSVDANGPAAAGARFITAEHWRLYQAYPQEMAQATKPYVDLLARELRAGQDAGLLPPGDAEQTAELTVMFVRSVYHHYAFAPRTESADVIAERVWQFCLSGLSGPH